MGLKNVDGAKNRKRRASHDDHLMISSWRGGSHVISLSARLFISVTTRGDLN